MDNTDVIGPSRSRIRRARFEKEGMPSSIDIHIPVEVVEGIISRLPVKSLIRFQSACKLLHSIISDPRFRQIHYGMTHNDNLYWVRPLHSFQLDRLVRVDSTEVKTEWWLEFPFFDVSVTAKRTCNGVVLMVNSRTKLMGLWNPSIRKHYCWIKAPPEQRDKFRNYRNYGFYYDPIIDDYKIAVVSPRYYTIYSCKSASWSETKPYPSIMPARFHPEEGFYVNGSSSFYWLKEDMGEIVCFDFRDEKLSKLPLPAGVDWDAYFLHLGTMSGRLCLLGRKRGCVVMWPLWVMEEHDHSWRELIYIEKGEPPMHLARPCIVTNEDSVILSLEKKITPPATKFFIYCLRERRLKNFSSNTDKAIEHMLPYSESLSFPVPENIQRRA